MIERIRLDVDEGGYTLLLEGDDGPEDVAISRVTHEALEAFSTSPEWRGFLEHAAEGRSVQAEFEAHRAAGRCTAWVPFGGPCLRSHGHEGPHDAERA